MLSRSISSLVSWPPIWWPLRHRNSFVGALAALAFVSAPLAAQAEPPETKLVMMSATERVTRIGVGVGSVGLAGGVMSNAGLGLVYGGLAAVGVTVAAPVVVAVTIGGLLAFGSYQVIKGSVGYEEVDASEARDGVNVGRNTPTRPTSEPGRRPAEAPGSGTAR